MHYTGAVFTCPEAFPGTARLQTVPGDDPPRQRSISQGVDYIYNTGAMTAQTKDNATTLDVSKR